jgi:heterodisulfide reductase subunit A
MALAKARLLEPLRRQTIKVQKSALVIGGGLSGMTASLALAQQGFDTYLVEKEEEFGGNLRYIHYLLNAEKPQGLHVAGRQSARTDCRVGLLLGAPF